MLLLVGLLITLLVLKIMLSMGIYTKSDCFTSKRNLTPGHCRGQDVQPDFHRPGRPEAAAAQEDHREGARGVRNQVCISHRSREHGIAVNINISPLQ